MDWQSLIVNWASSSWRFELDEQARTIRVNISANGDALMKLALCILLIVTGPAFVFAGEVEEQNKALARRFYEEVWFKNNPSVVDEIVAPTYIAHDIGDRKNSMEPAERAKEDRRVLLGPGHDDRHHRLPDRRR